MRFKDPTPKEHFSSFGISSAPSGVNASVMALITLSNLGSSINEVSSCKERRKCARFFRFVFSISSTALNAFLLNVPSGFSVDGVTTNAAVDKGDGKTGAVSFFVGNSDRPVAFKITVGSTNWLCISFC